MPRIKIFGKTINYNAYKDEMYMHKMRVRLINDKSFINVFKYNITNDFIKSMRRVVNPNVMHEENTIWSVYGETGSGKSSLVMSLCKILTPKRFSYKHFVFFDQDLLDLAPELPRDSFIVRDEGVDKAVFGIGSMRTARQLQVLAETCRKYGLNLVFIEPEFRRNEITKYYLETVDMDVEKRITRCAVKEPNTMQYIGAIYIPIVADNDKDWVAYNEIKDKFIDNMRKGKFVGSKVDYRKLAIKVAKSIDPDVFTKKSDRLALITTKFPHMTTQECKIIHSFVEIIIKHGENALFETENFEQED